MLERFGGFLQEFLALLSTAVAAAREGVWPLLGTRRLREIFKPDPLIILKSGPPEDHSEPGAREDAPPVAFDTGFESAAPAQTQTVRRTPHIDLSVPEPLQPGTSFDVIVFVDQQGARAGEESSDIEVRAGAKVDVFLTASAHFLIPESVARSMLVDASPRSEAPAFRLQVRAASEVPTAGAPFISALLMHEGRPCGKVRRSVQIAGVGAEPPSPAAAQFEIAVLKPADLHITIEAGASRDGRTFICRIHTPHLPGYQQVVSEPWVLSDIAGNLVRGYMGEFTSRTADASARIAALRGAGLQLFETAPDIFREVFWALIDAAAPLKDIAIVSEEPFIPWELMIPRRQKADGTRERRLPLGVEFRVGRWIAENMIAPRQSLKLKDSYIVAPDYADVRQRLASAQDEAKFVAASFEGELISPVRFKQIQDTLKTGRRTLVHFVCHGIDPQGGSQAIQAQIIQLENNEQLTSTTIEGMDGIDEAFAASKPIVFLNACEVGRPAPALVGLGGFAAAFIRLGASAVIAPLWSVKDTIAHEVAMNFYQRVKSEPATPMAEILGDLRKKAYESDIGEDTYAAYCFYGDPAASAGVS